MKTLLIVDDIPQNLYLLEVMLKTHGYQVQKAENGIDALSLARKNPPDMVISDILMPGMDGFNLCRAWKADELLSQIPFVFLTATYNDVRDEKFALSLGADRFLEKPIDENTFWDTLQEILTQQEIKRPALQEETNEAKAEFYKEYNQTLIRKLEDKMMQLQKSNKRLAALYQVSSNLHAIKSLPDLIDLILRSIIEIPGYQAANYFSFDASQKKLNLLSSVGFSEETSKNIKEKFDFYPGDKKGLAGLVAQNGQTINIGDTSKEPDWVNLDPSIKSALFTSVRCEDALLGVIGLFSQETNAFTEEDERDIGSLANNLAIAIDNNHNQLLAKKQLAHISALHNIDLAINSSMDLKTTLNIFVEHVAAQLKVDAVDVLLAQPNSSAFEYFAGRGFVTREIKGMNLRKGKSLDKKAVIERSLVRAKGLTYQEVTPEFKAMWAKEGFETYFAMPLISKGDAVGVLEVFLRELFRPRSGLDRLFCDPGRAGIHRNRQQPDV